MTNHRLWQSLEDMSPALFLAGGALLVLFTTLTAVELFLGLAMPAEIFGPAGFAVTLVALLGLYPTLANKSPRLVRVGAFFAAIGASAATIVATAALLTYVGIIAVQPTWTIAVNLILAGGAILGFLLFAIAGWRNPIVSRGLPVLLVAPAVIFIVLLIGTASGGPSPMATFITATMHALAVLGLAYVVPDEQALYHTVRPVGNPG